MNKNSLLALGIGFIAGVGLTWSYFNAASSHPESVKSQPSYEKQQKLHTEQQSNEVLSNADSAVPEQVASIEPAEISPTTNSETQMLDELPLEEQVTQLKQQLAEQKAALKSVLKKMRGPSDFEQILRDKFENQTRDEEWAYRTEMALQDFLLTADLSIIPDVVSAKCKKTVCEFELAAPTDNDTFGNAQWRELNDKLMEQEFWQQFKSTTSTSSDSELKMLLSTEL
ncbi:hypothetical protein H5085_07210 [Pseudoalteromonas sp. SR43-6]|uniref:hypothetical protein n=1 Tax=unclassified Pseudoalteromonas TaxID=194690 RepID=UPI0015FDE438|nr:MULTISPECIES: hypothetical protein [unclassified Pseudoalteromonas]MBB1288696.1 hypothetical protein [Pseudoalteromonas sp. SR41-5]MBB1374106.1 hypothetical protein [Pseudoalteromonas sp. SR43-6]MBB1413157.1 hypothetical protein [Pseudoalteromonas sp. SG43-8]